jgi:cell division protein FtsI (penicillin-binding protein 3)
MDVKTGEIIAMVSLPDFDPNEANDKNALTNSFNRNTIGTYEPGSTFKIPNVAIALESGIATLKSRFDATHPVQIGRFRVPDFRGQNRVLTLQEAFVYSSNIAAIKIAQVFGKDVQRTFLKKFGFFTPVRIEIPEIGFPLIPKNWTDVTTMTVAYGYGISVTPMQLLAGINGIINDGVWVNPTLLKKVSNEAKGERILSTKVSSTIRHLMRQVILEGTGRSANVKGYDVFGKTGTAYRAQKGRYNGAKSRMTTFIGGFPLSNPKYIIVVMLQDAKAIKTSHGFSTAGWNVAPTAGKIIQRIAPLLKILPANVASKNIHSHLREKLNSKIDTNHNDEEQLQKILDQISE